jgi:ribosome-binding factor A
MTTRRQRRVSELVHRELGTLLLFEARDPRLASVTITDVKVTRDLQLARIYFTVLGSDSDDKDVLAALQHATGYLRTQLAAKVELRLVPELAFELDQSAEHGRRIEELLNQLKESDYVYDEPQES